MDVDLHQIACVACVLVRAGADAQQEAAAPRSPGCPRHSADPAAAQTGALAA